MCDGTKSSPSTTDRDLHKTETQLLHRPLLLTNNCFAIEFPLLLGNSHLSFLKLHIGYRPRRILNNTFTCHELPSVPAPNRLHLHI